jgi:hypothetical protein
MLWSGGIAAGSILTMVPFLDDYCPGFFLSLPFLIGRSRLSGYGGRDRTDKNTTQSKIGKPSFHLLITARSLRLVAPFPSTMGANDIPLAKSQSTE